jgi:hypothetical protein
MTSGKVIVQVLEGENAVAVYRDVMGATNPKEAKDGTIRKRFGRFLIFGLLPKIWLGLWYDQIGKSV